MKKYVVVLTMALFAICAHAQLEGVINEVIYTDDGSIAGYPAGYSTYRIYALLHDGNDRVSSIYGSATGNIHPLVIGSTVPNSIWNAEDGGNYGGDILCTDLTNNPLLAYDSFITIGLSSSTADECIDCAGTEAEVLNFTITNVGESFDLAPNGNNLEVAEGAWFVLNDGSCNALGQGDDFRVLLAQ
ncbi:MAG: hypothetical protein JNM00_04295, partial [Flavobacteriales bacterium]|nr:hypothetical protein [Flavobacteriales bacterium]